MNENTGEHLDRQAVIRWQMGDATEAERRHMESCAACQAEAQPLNDALQWFGAAAREWGEQKAALSREWSGVRAAHVRTAAAIGWRVLVGTCAAVTIALLVIFGMGLPHGTSHQTTNQDQAQRQQAQQQEVASDNALLDEVDQDVSQEVPAALQPLSWNTSNSTGSSSAARQ